MNEGVIYYNTGTKCLVRLATSIYSLRKHYDGHVAILSEGAESDEYCKPISDALDCKLVQCKFDVPEGPQMTFMKKTLLHTVTPFDNNIFIDSDTLIMGGINQLHRWAKQYQFVATRFSNWVSTGAIMRGRIRNWEVHYPGLIEKAIKFGPALNAGCYAFRADADFLKVWYQMTLPGRAIHLPEETSMQVILPNYVHYVAPQEYNCSCKFSNPYHPDVRIIHYHRNKHCRIGLPHGADMWMRYFDRVMELNIGGIQKWHREHDKTLRIFLMDREKAPKAELKPSIPVETVIGTKYRRDDLTLVSAVSPNLMYAFKANFPTWQAKAQFAGLPMLIFHNGFENPDVDLGFVKSVPSAKLIHWTMPEFADLRELMISAFVLGTAKYVETPYFLKLDCDAYFSGREDVFESEHFEYELCGHRWGVSRLEMLQKLDQWADKIGLPGVPFLSADDRRLPCDGQTKFPHQRIISWICLHHTAFVREVAALAGSRLPVPSHDTFLWYMANRLGRRWSGTKLNRGTGHGKRLRQFMDARRMLADQGYIIKEN